MPKQPLLILGFSGNAIDAFDTVRTRYEIIGFIDDSPERQALSIQGIPVLGRGALDQYPEAEVITLIGSEANFRHREQIIGSFNIPESRFATVVHPAASVSSLAGIGRDVVVFPGVVIAGNAIVGNHVLILPNSVLHHDVVVGDFTLIGTNVTVAGHVRIGKACYLGSASSVKNGVEIGDGSLIGMAANITRPVAGGSTMVGNPARAR